VVVRKVRKLREDPCAIVIYNNFDFAEGRRGKRIGDLRELCSITTALTFCRQGILRVGLCQSSWQPCRYLLRSTEMIQKFAASEHATKVGTLLQKSTDSSSPCSYHLDSDIPYRRRNQVPLYLLPRTGQTPLGCRNAGLWTFQADKNDVSPHAPSNER